MVTRDPVVTRGDNAPVVMHGIVVRKDHRSPEPGHRMQDGSKALRWDFRQEK